MQNQIDTLLITRKFLLKITEDLTIEQLNKIPDGFKNNIAWNLAHLLLNPSGILFNCSMVKSSVIFNKNYRRFNH